VPSPWPERCLTLPPAPLSLRSNLKASCAAPADVPCEGNAPVACTAGSIREADTQQCAPCQLGQYHDTTADACVAW
jgi:hypothetical protein